MSNSRRSLLCLSGGDKFTKDKFKAASYLSPIHSMMLSDLFVFYDLMIYLLFIIVIFFLKLKFWGILLDEGWVLVEKLEFPSF